ncbi:MAG: cytochrome c3 family protein [Bacteroidales bacterium]
MIFQSVRFAVLFLIMVVPPARISGTGMAFVDKKAPGQDTVKYVSPFYEQNEKCFMCHGQSTYQYTNQNLGREMKALMCNEMIIKRSEFYRSNHRSFSCTDCHSDQYTTFPHPGELRMEQMYTCLDCHGNDEKFARYHFEEIQSEYEKSVHYKLEAEGFSCWECHNPHTYRISVRDGTNLGETILYDNNICLYCHANYDHFQLLSNREEINILREHDWLPNQALHFMNVRCIECHTKINDTVLVAHEILPKDNAVRLCNECHSRNSLLMSTLYKFQSKETRKSGFFNGVILNQSYVIGANRNEYLNLLSVVIFMLVVLIIGIHIFFRVLKK